MHKEMLSKIANVLYVNTQHIEENGLLRGKLGVAIFFYKYSRYSGNTIYADFADEILDYILEGVAKDSITNFAGGLSGLAWGIDYLMKNDFVDVDKSLLFNIDQIVKDLNVLSFDKDLDFYLPLFTKGLYFTQRNNLYEIRKIVFELNEYLKINNRLPDVYIESIRFFLTKSINKNIETDLCICMMQNLPNKSDKSEMMDLFYFYNHCWECFLYNSPVSLNLTLLSYKHQLELFLDNIIDNLNSQKLSIYKGLAGLGCVLIELDKKNVHK